MRILILLLSALYLPISWASCSLKFEPKTGSIMPQTMINALAQNGWSITSVSPYRLDAANPTVSTQSVFAYKKAFTYTYAGTTKGMCDISNKWELIPQAEKDAFSASVDSYINLTPTLMNVVKVVNHGFNLGIRPITYQSSMSLIPYLPNDWVSSPYGFGYTTRAQNSNAGTPTASTDTMIFLDTTDVHSYAYPSILQGHILNPPNNAITPWDLLTGGYNTHASKMAAVVLNINGAKINNYNVGNGTGYASIDREFYALMYNIREIPVPKVTVVATPFTTPDVEFDRTIEQERYLATTSIPNKDKMVMIGGTMNNVGAGTDCQIGNYWVYGYESIFGYHSGYCITPEAYSGLYSPVNGWGYEYTTIDQSAFNILLGQQYDDNNNDFTQTLSFGIWDNTTIDGRLWSVGGTKTDLLCEFDGFNWASSSMCTSAAAGLATVIIKNHPDFTAQCIVDTFINATKARTGIAAKTGDGKGYGVMKADDVLAWADSHQCGNLQWFEYPQAYVNWPVSSQYRFWTDATDPTIKAAIVNACSNYGGTASHYNATEYYCKSNTTNLPQNSLICISNATPDFTALGMPPGIKSCSSLNKPTV